MGSSASANKETEASDDLYCLKCNSRQSRDHAFCCKCGEEIQHSVSHLNALITPVGFTSRNEKQPSVSKEETRADDKLPPSSKTAMPKIEQELSESHEEDMKTDKQCPSGSHKGDTKTKQQSTLKDPQSAVSTALRLGSDNIVAEGRVPVVRKYLEQCEDYAVGAHKSSKPGPLDQGVKTTDKILDIVDRKCAEALAKELGGEVSFVVAKRHKGLLIEHEASGRPLKYRVTLVDQRNNEKTSEHWINPRDTIESTLKGIFGKKRDQVLLQKQMVQMELASYVGRHRIEEPRTYLFSENVDQQKTWQDFWPTAVHKEDRRDPCERKLIVSY